MTPTGIALLVASAVVLLVAGLALTAVLGIRLRIRVIVDAVRRFNKLVANPRQVHTAGRAGARMALLRHRGRVTGREYVTPIGAVPEGDGFVTALPYGASTDWVRNLLAAGTATLVVDGHEVEVEAPEVVAVGSTRIASDETATVRLFGVREAVRMRRR